MTATAFRDISPRFSRFLFALALLAFLAAPVLASAGVTPIYQLPLTITEPGSYYLSRDLAHSGGGQAITIEASNVLIDFRGHTLTKENSGNYAIASDGDYGNITIRNGTLVGGNIGVRLRNASGLAFNVVIEGMTIRDCLNEGISIEGHNTLNSSAVYVRENQISGVDGDGIFLRYVWGGRVSGNSVLDVGNADSDHGIELNNCRGVTVTGNTVAGAFGDGIRAWYSHYSTFDWNHMSHCGGWGLNIYQGVSHVYSNNRAYGNDSGGFTVPVGDGINAGGNYPNL